MNWAFIRTTIHPYVIIEHLYAGPAALRHDIVTAASPGIGDLTSGVLVSLISVL